MNYFKYGLLFLIITLIGGCSKDEASDYNQVGNDVSSFSAVAVFNAIPNSTGLIVSIGEGNLKKTPVSTTDRLSFGNYLTYKNWVGGDLNLSIENYEGSFKKVFDKKISLSLGKFYSLFFYNQNEIKVQLSEDNVISPADGKLKVRVAHFSENLTSVDIISNSKVSSLFKNIAFGTVSPYVEVDLNELQEFVVKSVDEGVELDFKSDKSLVNKGVYTILLKSNYERTSDIKDLITLIKQ